MVEIHHNEREDLVQQNQPKADAKILKKKITTRAQSRSKEESALILSQSQDRNDARMSDQPAKSKVITVCGSGVNNRLQLNLILVGNSRVGKTSILVKHFKKQFDSKQIETVGVEFIAVPYTS